MAKISRRSFINTSSVLVTGAGLSGFVQPPSSPFLQYGSESPVAITVYGKIRGYVDDGINVFKGISIEPLNPGNDPRGEERKIFAKVPFIQAGT